MASLQTTKSNKMTRMHSRRKKSPFAQVKATVSFYRISYYFHHLDIMHVGKHLPFIYTAGADKEIIQRRGKKVAKS